MPALKPLPSPARLEANRANAEKSTGPSTAAGKARSRTNAVKHGLTGAGIALPGEDQARVEGRFAALRDELGPATLLGAHFVGKIALMTVRSERAARQESAALAHRVRHAADEFDRQRRDAAEALLAGLDVNPAAGRRDLVRTPEGVDALVDTLLDLRATLNRPRPEWSAEHEAHFEACHGRRVGDRGTPRGLALSRAILGDPALLGPAERAPALASWIRALIDEIDAEVDRLAAHRATLDHAAIAADRAGAADRALFDPGRDATLARRYEAASTRELYRALDEFRAAEAAGPRPPCAADPAPPPLAPPIGQPIEKPATVVVNSHPGHEMTPPLASFGGRGMAPAASGVASDAGWCRSPGRVHPGDRPGLGPETRPAAFDLALPGSGAGL